MISDIARPTPWGCNIKPPVSMFQIVAIVALIFAVTPAAADASVAWEALRKGGHVALMRHADAPGGAGDPPGFKLDDCSTQRNLSERGRADAVAMGAQIRAKGISAALAAERDAILGVVNGGLRH